MELSIVIPALDESNKIAADIKAAAEFLAANSLTGEIIIVDDGSSDNTAQNARNTLVPHNIKLNVISYPDNRGKGHAVKTGIVASKGKYVLFADSGLCIPFNFALEGIKLIQSNSCDIAHGSRKMKNSRIIHKHLLHRQILSRIFRWLVHAFMGIPQCITDTQCGFKIYRGDIARELYAKCISERFAFDIEIILRAIKAGHKIKEFPVEWNSDHDTRFHIFSNSLRTLFDLLAIKKAILNGD
jgi:dolichyl-phosphate beta-glucosyltransferase